MDQEQRYLGALTDVTECYLYGSLLWLRTEDERTLAFAVQRVK
jgi:hypothetical protein